MTEGQSGELLVSESDWKSAPSGRSRTAKLRGPKRTVRVAGPCASRLSESVTVRLSRITYMSMLTRVGSQSHGRTTFPRKISTDLFADISIRRTRCNCQMPITSAACEFDRASQHCGLCIIQRHSLLFFPKNGETTTINGVRAGYYVG